VKSKYLDYLESGPWFFRHTAKSLAAFGQEHARDGIPASALPSDSNNQIKELKKKVHCYLLLYIYLVESDLVLFFMVHACIST